MHKFTEGKGKAFSYFSIVAKNYLILHNNNNYKKLKQTDDESVTDYKRDAMSETKRADLLDAKKEYVDLFVDYWTNNLTTVFKRKQDMDVANSVIYLMENLYIPLVMLIYILIIMNKSKYSFQGIQNLFQI